ncbi:unannotated protein [freshwater metagenome]|uniref:Unannotated protein n=1 Tax=freshwater metagenome TaxID=449393 RepID=A0A6J6BJF9_9ZZZZ
MRPSESAVFDDPLDLRVHQQKCCDGGSVESLVESRVLDRDAQRQELRNVSICCGDASDPVDCGGGHECEPQAAIARKVLLRRKVIHIGLARINIDTASRARRINNGEGTCRALTAHRGHRASRCFVVRVRKHVRVLVTDEYRDGSRITLDDSRGGQPRCARGCHKLLPELSEG